MIITTSYKVDEFVLSKVEQISKTYELSYIPRKKHTLNQLIKRHQCPIILVTHSHIRYVTADSQVYFHPNLAQVRSKRIESGGTDALIESCKLERGMSFLDCTLGLATDSLIVSQVIGDTGKIVALESNPIMHLVTNEGLKHYPFESELLDRAAKRIQIEHINSFDYLKQTADQSFDVVYFDPMFDTDIKEETPFSDIKTVADYHSLDMKTIAEAKRVAKKYVIMKNHYLSESFETLGFIRLRRKTSQFHYGIIQIH